MEQAYKSLARVDSKQLGPKSKVVTDPEPKLAFGSDKVEPAAFGFDMAAFGSDRVEPA